jgi:TonB-dependent SusC/RagA subfamily outer membrane receptor
MKALLIYLLQVIVASGILYAYYHFFLRNREFHQYNRFYLLSAVVISLLVPFLQIPVYFSGSDAASSPVLRGLQTIPWSSEGEEFVVSGAASSPFSVWDLLPWLYALVGGWLTMRLLVSFIQIHRLLKKHRVEKLEGIHFVNTEEPGTPFTFFRWLFWDKKIALESESGKQIFRHEIFHIQQRHSWDVLGMEIVRTILWMNPFFHLIKKELRAIHEFLADEFAVREQEKWAYAEFLLMQALQSRHRLVNPFFHSQIKRRIAMITNSQKTSHRYLRKVLALPLAVLVLGLVAFKVKSSGEEPALSGPPLKVVIDPGHGGMDPGAKARDLSLTEAQLTLAIAQKIQSMADAYNIDVVLTRDSEEASGNASNKSDDIRNRLAIAKNSGADFIVSLHINSAPATSAEKRSGIEAFISNKPKGFPEQLLASSLLESLSEIYTTSPTVNQRNNNGIYLLDHAPIPATLLELGYLTNKKDQAFIADASNQEEIARKILLGIRKFGNQYSDRDNAATIETIAVKDTTPVKAKNVVLEPVSEKNVELKPVSEKEKQDVTKIRIRGEADPLFIINGEIVKPSERIKLDTLSPTRIKAINVLKGETATNLYGEKGTNGVVSITTKEHETVDLKEVVVEGKPAKNYMVSRKGEPAREVQLQEVPAKKYRVSRSEEPLQEIVVEGRATLVADKIELREARKTDELNEVVVVGYSKNNSRQEPLFDQVEQNPQPKGGEAAWRKHLEKNLDINIAVKNNAPLGRYTVKIRFIIEKDGSISQLAPLTMHGYGMEEEAIRVIKSGPGWEPAQQNGKKVRAYRTQPITFLVQKEEERQSLMLREKAVDLSETSATSGILYPNPADQQCTIQLKAEKEGPATIRIVTVAGETTGVQKNVNLIKGNNTLSLATNTLKAGTYFVQVLMEGNKGLTYKLIKN